MEKYYASESQVEVWMNRLSYRDSQNDKIMQEFMEENRLLNIKLRQLEDELAQAKKDQTINVRIISDEIT